MKKDEWEKFHGFRQSEHNCTRCKHVEIERPDAWTNKYRCKQKRLAGAGESTKASYECDLWEHE